MSIEKSKAAAIAAVAAYLQLEAETAALAAAESPPAAAVQAAPRLWGASGRQEQMQLRQLMQLKTFHGARATGRR
jgi:hypothetical protein